MANEVTIIVKSKDKTDFKPIGDKARKQIGEGVEGGLDDAEKATEKRAPEIGDKAGTEIGEKTRTSMKGPIEEGLNDTERTFKERFYQIGDYSGLTLSEKLDEHLRVWSERIDDQVGVTVKEKFREVGDHGGESLGAGLDDAVESITRVGRRAGDKAGSGFIGSLGDLGGTIKSAWIPMLIAALLPELPAIGALAATAIVFAFGAGLAALGLVAAWHLKSVQKEFAGFKKFLGGFMKDIGKPFEGTWKSIFGTATSVLKDFQPVLKGAFKDFVAPAVTSFVVNLGKAFKNLEPAIVPLAAAFSALLDSIGQGLPGIFKDISDALIDMSDSIAANPQLFAGFITGLLSLIPIAMKVIGFLTRLFGAFSKFEHSSNPFKLMLAALSPALAILMHLGVAGKVFGAIGDAAKTIGPKIGDLFDKIKAKAGPILDKIGGQIKNELVPAFTDFLHSAAPLAGVLIAIFTPEVVSTITNILNVLSGLIDLLSGFLKISSGIMSGDWSKMWDGMKDVAKGGAKIIGAAVKSLLDGLTLGHGDKVIKLTLSAVNKVEPVAKDAMKAAKSFAHGVYRALLTAHQTVTAVVHVAEAVAKRFARGSYRAALTAHNVVHGAVSAAASACSGFARRAYRANLTAMNKVGAILASALRDGYNWAGRVFTATFNVRKIISDLNPFNAHGGIIGGLATGGMPRGQAGGGPGGSLTWVGEQGAELVRLPTGSQVYPHGNSMGMAAQASGGALQVTAEWIGGNATDPFFQWIRDNIRIRVGSGPNSVQKALGAR